MQAKLEILHRAPVQPNSHQRSPLLFIHGAYCGAAIWSTYFLPWFAARGWHAYALSLEGHGRSEGHGWLAALSIDDYVRNLSDVVVTFPTPPVLIAHSMGGFVLQRYLERENPSAGNVLLASVPPRGLTQSSLRLLQHSPAVFSTLNIFQSDGVRQIPLERTKRLLFSDDLPAELLISWLPTFQAESMRAIFDMLMVGLLTPPATAHPTKLGIGRCR